MKRFWEKLSVTETRNTLAVVVIVGVMILPYFLSWVNIPTNNKETVNYLGSALQNMGMLILGYYFGSSKQDKVDNQGK